MHDNRDLTKPITYIAETGVLAQTPAGARLIMLKGNIERSEASGSRLSVLKFDRYVFDLDEYAGQPRANERETSERYLSELLEPQLTGANQEARRGVYLAEAHNRLSAPLYCLAFALIALAATAKGHMARASYALRLSGAALMGAVLRLLGYAAQGAAARNPQFLAVLYVIPLLGILLGAAILADIPLIPMALRRLFARAPREATT